MPSFISCLNYSYTIVVVFTLETVIFRGSHASFSSHVRDCIFLLDLFSILCFRWLLCFNMCIIHYYALKIVKHLWTYSNVWIKCYINMIYNNNNLLSICLIGLTCCIVELDLIVLTGHGDWVIQWLRCITWNRVVYVLDVVVARTNVTTL